MTKNDRQTITAPEMDRGRLRQAVEDAFTEVALHPSRKFHFFSGPRLAQRLGYLDTSTKPLPATAFASFCGVGNPFRMGSLRRGEVVLDIGCGSGVDALLAARQVGSEGQVIGIDMTSAMVERAQQNVLTAGASNVRIEWGYAESLPVQDNSIDCVISNGVFTLTPNKRDTFMEIARVLKPGGRLQICDVLIESPIPKAARAQVRLWTCCVAGGTLAPEYKALLDELGFESVEIVERFDVFDGTRIENNARRFQAYGANVRAIRPCTI